MKLLRRLRIIIVYMMKAAQHVLSTLKNPLRRRKHLRLIQVEQHIIEKCLMVGIFGVIIIPLIAFWLSFSIPKYNKTLKVDTYTAKDLEFRHPKTSFSVKEKPTFKVYVGEIKHVDNSPKARLLRTLTLVPRAEADDTKLPDIDVTLHHIVRESDTEEVVIRQSGPDEVEIAVADIKTFKPGKYHISITSGKRNIEQDFTWGVLAVNTNKSIYSPGETAKIGMGLLDDIGRTKCFNYPDPLIHGEVWLTITDPHGKRTELSTKNGLVTGSENCAEHSVTNDADFQTSYKTTTPGMYQMHMIGENQNGKRTLDDYFEVTENQDYVVERTSLPTRIYPSAIYTNTLTVSTKSAFKGQIKETTPASFHITCDSCEVQGADSLNNAKEPADKKATHTIIWNVDWSTGGTHTLTYSFDPPRISPEFYILGPLTIANSSNTVFTEARPWQIASDAVVTWNGNGVDNNWNTAGNWAGGVACTAAANDCTFDGSNPTNGQKNASINVSISVNTISMLATGGGSGYTGIITQGAATTVTTAGTGGITVSAGTFTGSAATITMNTAGVLTVSGGTFNAGTGTFTASTASNTYRIVVSSGTYTGSASGTRTLSGGGIQVTGGTFTGGGATYNLSSTGSNAGLTVSGGTFDGGSGPWTLSSTNATTSGVSHSAGSFTGGSGAWSLSGATGTGYLVTGGTDHTTTTSTLSIVTNLTVTGVTTWTNSASSITFATGGNSTTSCDRVIGTNFILTKTSGTPTYTNGASCSLTFATWSGSTTLASFTNNGIATSSAGAGTLTMGDSTITNDRELTNNATINFQRTFNNSRGILTNSGTITHSTNASTDAGAFTCQNTIGGTFNMSGANSSTFTISDGAGGDCVITSITIVSGNYTTFTNAGTITLGSGTLIIRNGAAGATDGDVINTGSLTIGASATLNIERDFDSSTGTLVNSGTLSFQDNATDDNGILSCSASTTLNGTVGLDKDNGTATFTIGTNCTITNGVAIGTSNNGTFTVNGSLTVASGTLLIRDFDLVVGASGSLSIGASGTIQAERNVTVSGSISNSGTLSFVDNASNDSGTFSCSSIVNGTVNLDKDIGATTFTLGSGCTITNAVAIASSNNGTFTINGSLTLASGTLLVRDANLVIGSSGAFTINSGAVVNAERNWTESSGSVTTNNGTIRFIDNASSDSTTLTCGTGSNLGKVDLNKVTGGNTFVLGSDCTTGNFNRISGIISNPASAYTLKVQGNLMMSSTTNMGGANMTVSMEGSGFQFINFAATSTTFVSKFQVNKTGGSAMLLTNNFTVTGQACTVAAGTFDINGLTFVCNTTGLTVSSGGNLQLQGAETITLPGNPTLSAGSTVTYAGNKNAGANTYALKSWSYSNLTISSSDSATDIFQPAATLSVGNDLTNTAGSLDAKSGSDFAMNVTRDFSNSGTFLAQGGTLTVGRNFTNNGTFTAGTGTLTLNTTTTATLAGSGSPAVTLNNLTIATSDKTVQFTAGQTFRTNGLLTITGTSGHNVIINSTTSSQWFINHQGTEAITYATITYSGCDGASTDITLASSDTNGGNNGACWLFVADMSGTIYTDEGTTPYDCSANNLTINLSVNGGSNATTTCTLNTGVFSFTSVTGPSDGTPFTVFIDSTETPKATLVMLGDGSAIITGLKLYVSHVTLSHLNAGPITNANLATADNADAGIRYSVASSNLTVDSGMELYVLNSKTYTPGGTVTTQGSSDFQLASSATSTLDTATNTIDGDIVVDTGATLNINTTTSINGGAMTTAGTGVITTTSGTPTVTISGTGTIGGGGTVTVYALTVNGTQTLASDTTISNTANVAAGGSLDLGSKNMTVSGGSFTNTSTGIIACSGCSAGTLTMSGTGTLGSGNGNITIYNLTTSGTGTTTFSGGGTNTISNNVTVGTGTTLNINSTTAITGSLANTTTGIIGTTSGTPTVTVSGSTIGGGSGALTFYNLTKAGAGTTTFSGSGTNSITNNLSISNGTFTQSNTLTITGTVAVSTGATYNNNADLNINGGAFTTAGTGVINTTSGTPTVTISGTGNLGSGNGNITLYNLTTTGTGTTTFSGAGTNTINNNVSVGAGTTLNINSTVGITGSLTNTTSGIIGTTSGTPTVTVSGTSIGGGTTGAITFYNLTKAGAGTTTFSNGGTNTINNNLSVSNGTLTQSSALTVTNDISVSTGATFNTNATLTVNGGDMTTAGTGVISTTAGTATVTMTGTGNIGGGGAVTVYSLTSSSGTQTISSTTTINNTLTVNGTINGSSNLTVNADFTGTGTVTMSGGTTEQRVGAAQNFGTDTGSNNWSFATLIFSNSTGTSKTVTTQSGGSGGITVSTLLQVGKGGDSAVTVLDAANRTWTLTGTSGTPFTVPNGTFTASTSTVSYTGNNGAGNTTIRDVTYNNLTVNNGSETWNLASSPLNVNENLTVSAGTLDLQTNSANIGSTGVANSGGISVSGTITQSSAGTTTVKTSASGTASIGGSGTITFYNLTIAPTATSTTIILGTAGSQTITVSNNLSVGDGSNAVTVSASTYNPIIDVNGSFTTNASGTFVAPQSTSFTIAGSMTNNGTFNHNSGTVTLDTTATATLAGSGNPAITFNNLTVTTPNKTVLFTSTETFQTNGLLTITGTTGNPVTIDATTNGNQWFINHQGTESITYAAIQDSGCDGSSTTITLITTNTDNGTNGTCWAFSSDISGVIYSDEGSTPFDCSGANLTIDLSVNGGTNYTATCTLNTGVFSFSTIPQPASGTPLAFFVDNANVASAKATTITRAPTPSTSITGIKLYKDHVVLTHQDAGPITNANLATADNADAGIRYSVASSNLTVDSGMELYVLNSKTYTPGGTVTTQGSSDFQLASSATSTLDTSTNAIAGNVVVDTGATLTINADTTVSGGGLTTAGTGIITNSSNTPTVTVSGTGTIGGGGAVTIFNLTSSSGTQTLSSTTLITNTLTVNGTLSGSSSLTVYGNLVGTGTVSHTGTTEQRISGSQNFGTTSGSNAWSFGTLIFSNGAGSSRTVTTQTGGSGTITVSTLLQIGKGGDAAVTVLDAGNRTWTLSGTSGTPFTLPQGTFTPNTSTVSYTGNNSGGNTTFANTTYNNLSCNNGSETYNAAASPLNVSGDLTVTAGTLDMQTNSLNVGSTSVANSGDIAVAGTLTQSASGTTTVKTSAGGTATIGGAGTLTFYNLTIAPTAAGGTITLGSAGGQTLSVSNNLSIGDGANASTITADVNTPIIDVNGSFTINASGIFVAPPFSAFRIASNMTNNGTFTPNGGTVTFDTTGTSIIAGSGNPAVNFYNLSSTTAGKTLQFTAGETFQTDGNITITDVSINSTSSSQWFINHLGSESITGTVTITYSGCDSASTNVSAIIATDGGNNGSCWKFAGQEVGKRIKGTSTINGNVRFK